jgi:SAM-dependent methyltransferase
MKDNFSSNAATYAQFRPTYPPELYEFLLSLVSQKETAWDCGCGNGQVAGVLADYFNIVHGTDMSQQQLDHAVLKPNIRYSQAKAEESGLPGGSVDLITVAQAIHWFNIDGFYKEVIRVGKPGSIIAVWCYSLLSANPAVDAIIKHLYADTLGNEYWDAERHYVDEEYQTIPFPFDEIEAPNFSINVDWTVDHLIGYLSSWSAVQHYIKRNGVDPISSISNRLKDAWGDQPVLKVQFPLFCRIGKLSFL